MADSRMNPTGRMDLVEGIAEVGDRRLEKVDISSVALGKLELISPA